MTQAQDIADLKRRVTLLENPHVNWVADFTRPVEESGFSIQAKYKSRVTRANGAVRLQTKPGDNNIYGSGDMERCDLALTQELSDGFEGHEAWWAHSVLFPDDYVAPTANANYSSSWNIIFDFHNSAPGNWQANFAVEVVTLSPDPGNPLLNPYPPVIRFRGYGGVNSGDGEFMSTIGQFVENASYEFVYHVRWSSGPDGFIDGWVNGERKLAHQGPTLYAGQGIYLKLAQYRVPDGMPSAIIHSRVIRGETWQSVSSGPLEGMT